MADAPRVFISYSHDSEEHADRVLALADALCDGGIDVILDRYVHPAPSEGWPLWMERNLNAAKFVLMICTETYRRRVLDQEAPGKGIGVRWVGKLIYNRICYDKPAGPRFIPILLNGSRPEHIPDPVRGHNHYVLAAFDLSDPQYEALYRNLTDQPATPRPGGGSIKKLTPKPRSQPSPSPLAPAATPRLHFFDEQDFADDREVSAGPSQEGEVALRLKINRHYDSFDTQKQSELLKAIGTLLRINGEIEVVDKRRGCVQLTIKLTREQAEMLRSLVEQGLLESYGVADTQIVAPTVSQFQADEQKRSEVLNELKRNLKSLSSENIRDEEDDQPQRLLIFLHKTLRCDFDLEPSGLEERLAAFLTEYRPYTLTGLDKAYSLICDQNLKTAASRIAEIIRLVFPFQLPQELWACVLEQHKQGRPVLANAAPGVVFAEAVAARIDGKPIEVSRNGEGIKAPNRFGPFPVELSPFDAPEETLRSLVKVLLLISANFEMWRTGEAGTMTVAHMMSFLRGFFASWRNLHQRTPYVVVRMPKDTSDRTNYERALAQIKEGVEHVMFLEYCADPAAIMVEGGLLGFLHTHLDSERKWKTP